jgi:hypothetical protein
MSDPVFLGYVVHLPGVREYLARMNAVGNNGAGWLWSIDPGHAVRYNSLKAAKQITDIYGNEAVVKMLWESDNQLLLTELEN